MAGRLNNDNVGDYYVKKSIYLAVFVNSTFLDLVKSDIRDTGMKIPYNCFFGINPRAYLNNEIRVSEYKNDTIVVKGRMPLTKNEVLISGEVADRIGIQDEKGNFATKSYPLLDIYDGKYDHNFDDGINLYDYLGPEITIVGVADVSGADVLLMPEIYEYIAEEYSNLYFFDEIGLTGETAVKYAGKIINKGYWVGYYNLSYPEDLKNELDLAFPLALFFLGIVIILLAAMMVLHIRFEIRDNYHNIGIFKAIGLSETDITRIFLRKPVRNLGRSLGIGLLLYILFVIAVNLGNTKVLGYRKFITLLLDFPPVIIAMIAIYVIGVFLAWVTIKGTDKKTLIGVIRS